MICRYAVLRATALHLPYAAPLYGTPPLTVTLSQTKDTTASSSSNIWPASPVDSPSDTAADAAVEVACDSTASTAIGKSSKQSATAAGSAGAGGAVGDGVQVAGGDSKIQELEARLGGTLGIEVSLDSIAPWCSTK